MSTYKQLYMDCLDQLIANGYAKDEKEAREVCNQIAKEIVENEWSMISIEEILHDYGLEMDYAELFML